MLFAQTKYEKAWESLNNNDFKNASQLINEVNNSDTAFIDNYITNVYLQTYNGKDDEVTDFVKSFYNSADTPYPYIYALWFNGSILGPYGLKKNHQIEVLDRITNDAKAPGNIVAAASYQKGMHYLSKNDFKTSAIEYSKVGNIKNWQYLGPFENISGSSFDKNYGQVEHPEGTEEFTIKGNTKVKWFVPTVELKDGWTAFNYIFDCTTGLVFAQTFVDSPTDQEVYCNFGVSGSLKVWLNDQLILSEPTDRVTEMDAYTSKCKLQKGNNRFLVQVGFEDASYPNFNLRITDENHKAIDNLKGSSIYKPYTKALAIKPTIIQNTAEEFFQRKILAQPDLSLIHI